MSRPLEDYDNELGGTLGGSVLRAAAGHVLIGLLLVYGLVTHPPRPPSLSDIPFFLGYPGKTHYAPDLEVLQPGSLHFSFYQPPQSGVAGSQKSADAKDSKLVTQEPAPKSATPRVDRAAQSRKVAPSAAGALRGSSLSKAQALHGTQSPAARVRAQAACLVHVFVVAA